MSKLTTVSVSRNDVTLNFAPTEVKKGKEKGRNFLGPEEIKPESLDNWISWIGKPEVCQMVYAILRQRAKGWSDEAEDESATQKDGDTVISFDEQKYVEVFSQMAKDFSARGESIPELRDQIEELTAKFASLDFSAPEAMVEGQKLAQQIKSLQIAIQSKRRQTKEEAAAPQPV